MSALSFEILKKDKDTNARLGLIRTRRGDIRTPYLVPVATMASVRSLGPDDLAQLGVQCALANTYHLHLKPGDELIRKLGGLHKFMGFPGPLFSDSGGFQAFSLGFGREHNISKIGNIFPEELQCYRNRHLNQLPSNQLPASQLSANQLPVNQLSRSRSDSVPKKENLTKITDEGISFKSMTDGQWHFLNAESSMKIQSNLDTDIIMAFDECTSPLSDYDYTKKAMQRTHVWAEESLRHHDPGQALYGIIQGGWFEDLRDESTKAISSLSFDGIAVGGSLGNSKQDMHQVLDWTLPKLDDRPRHLLGIGEIDDLFEGVERGIDTFDCVSPTRIARRGSLFISPESGGCLENKFRINIKAARFREDGQPVDQHCRCLTCRSFSRAYLRYLYSAGELSYFRLATLHNLQFMLRLMEEIREGIEQGTLLELKRKWLGRI
ncbi:MAG: tRNA guanosine(34) transglycosylase Tgt [Methanothrix sp.]|nr:MAG: tRNA guanosine(34) transglycosylase Tgt [Methanothrix sp.]